MRDRLVELMEQADEYALSRLITDYKEATAAIADYLIENGVIVLPCKVGTVVYCVCKWKYPVDSYRMNWEEDWVVLTRLFDLSMIPEIGKTVFLTRKEAEQALEENGHD